MSIEPLTPTDLDTIYAIEIAANNHPWQKNFFSSIFTKHHSNWVIKAKADQQIMGFAILQIVNDQGELLNIGIHPAAQRKGYGQALLSHLIAIAREKNLQTIFLEVRASNLKAQNLYRKLGFNEMTIRKNYYPSHKGREDAILMAKDIF